MSAAAATATANDLAPKKKGKKTLLIIVAAVLVLAIAGGGGVLYLMKKRAAEAEAAAAAEEGDAPVVAKEKHDEKRTPPVFMPLDAFTVNLADRDAERYAQVGVTLEMEDQHAADELKLYMPAVRNNILLVLADKTAADLMAREGKEKLAREIRREALKPLGFEFDAAEAAATGEDAHAKKKKKEPAYPVRAVQFSNFIIQ